MPYTFALLGIHTKEDYASVAAKGFYGKDRMVINKDLYHALKFQAQTDWEASNIENHPWEEYRALLSHLPHDFYKPRSADE